MLKPFLKHDLHSAAESIRATIYFEKRGEKTQNNYYLLKWHSLTAEGRKEFASALPDQKTFHIIFCSFGIYYSVDCTRHADIAI